MLCDSLGLLLYYCRMRVAPIVQHFTLGGKILRVLAGFFDNCDGSSGLIEVGRNACNCSKAPILARYRRATDIDSIDAEQSINTIV